MALRIPSKDIPKLLLHFCSGQCSRSLKRSLFTSSSHFNYLPFEGVNDNRKLDLRDRNYQRYSVSAEKVNNKVQVDRDLLTYIGAVIDELQGPSHYWLNKYEDPKNDIRKSRGFLVLSGDFLGTLSRSSPALVLMIKRAKLLQQRYPWLQVIGFQYSKSVSSSPTRAHLLQSIMSEYITFPVILSSKTFTEMKSGSYIMFKDFGGPIIYHEKDVDLSVLDKAVRDLELLPGEEPRLEDKLKGSWVNPVENANQPHLPLQNLLFCFPGCISVDSGANRLFVSDANHHRIIVTDINGQILDSIGSSPGFEDGDFECAKLLRPASSFYHDAEDCLYFVDSENHAIRKADMEKRVVETIYPTTSKDSSVWGWVLDKVRLKRDSRPQAKEITSESFSFPWHVLSLLGSHLYVLNRSFETLWILNLDTGVIKEIVKGAENILQNCGPMILEKSRLLGRFPSDWLRRQDYDNFSLEGVPHAGLVSSVAALRDHLFACDTDGRVDIKLNIDIPQDTDLVEPLQECCVWRQTRGSAIEVSGADKKLESTEQTGISQQWYDELHDLAALVEPETTDEVSSAPKAEVAETKTCINCSIFTSPGQSEVIIYAVLYLKLKRDPSSVADHQEKKLSRLAELLNPIQSVSRNSVVHLLSKSNQNAEEFVFMKPLHVRLKFVCDLPPKSEKSSKHVVLTDSSVGVDVLLR